MSNNANIGYLFSRLMYLNDNMQEQTFADDVIAQSVITACPMNQTEESRKITLDEIPGTDEFELQVAYPGLYCGLGYAHGIGGAEDTEDYKTGFYFDHTTGLPVLPGSSVKGVLRSAMTQYPELVFSDQERKILGFNQEKTETPKLILDLFGSENKRRPAIKGQAIFFDAFPCARQDGYMADDYITPHMKRTAAPNPIHTLKVKPGVEYCFRFRLPEQLTYGEGEETLTVTKAELLEKFKKILVNLGIGAKTNTGYGYFKDQASVQSANAGVQPANTQTQPLHNSTSPQQTSQNIHDIKVDRQQIDKGQITELGNWPYKLCISKDDKKAVLQKINSSKDRTVRIRVKCLDKPVPTCEFVKIFQ